jgi:hypothetical protein
MPDHDFILEDAGTRTGIYFLTPRSERARCWIRLRRLSLACGSLVIGTREIGPVIQQLQQYYLTAHDQRRS